ncbi:MAG: DUF3109 family protein [Ignavibacteriae bacterium]|nr:DUF3109 family protein [Ignavibacteriota bacterium]
MTKDNKKYFIDDRLFTNKFFCNLEMCKGGCCTIRSRYGAPLEEEEIGKIEEVFKKVEAGIPERNLEVIEKKGFWFREGEKIYLNNVNDEDCVFSYIAEGGIARCIFETSFRKGEIDFKKPISCELFPIRVYGEERNVLRYERMSECDDAISKGGEMNSSVFEFLKEALERAFGKDFFNNFKHLINDK